MTGCRIWDSRRLGRDADFRAVGGRAFGDPKGGSPTSSSAEGMIGICSDGRDLTRVREEGE